MVSGEEYPDIVRDTESMLAAGVRSLVGTDARALEEFHPGAHGFCTPNQIQASRTAISCCSTVDDVAVLLAAQQSSGGGVLAGHNYHWYGIRDQNGVGRTLLYLGEPQQARAIYDFYWSIWQRYHVLHNGEGEEPHMFFHIHENDGAEIPGYLILGAFEILASTA